MSAASHMPIRISIPVTPDNFTRAETDLYFGKIVREGGFGQFHHNRQLTAPERQFSVRPNRDTLYSGAVFDLAAGPVTIIFPHSGARFMSMMIVDEDEYVLGVIYRHGRYTYARDTVRTRYLCAAVRTFADAGDPADLIEVHALQDAIRVKQKSPGRFEIPDWDAASQKEMRDALAILGKYLPDSRSIFGMKEHVDPVRHLIGAAVGWGGNPERDASYTMVTPAWNDGNTAHRLRVKDVPVDGFWSVTVYTKDGYLEKNSLNAYSVNNVTAKKDGDGAVTIQFGGDPNKAANYLPVTPGWNYTVRMYRPHPEILDGRWRFPDAQPIR
ncbi:MAG TPA: DUF1214 domain-containing protein [Rhizomicrobium sp.]|nr:DUF1214 domain-containing protein [Rhizomicrobium sp.]